MSVQAGEGGRMMASPGLGSICLYHISRHGTKCSDFQALMDGGKEEIG